MKENNVEIIRRILDGDKEAFSILVQKYQKKVHALAWRKLNDYHIAEDITQETFVKAYNKLSTLKNPRHFDGWLYVIATRNCINWIKRNKSPIQSIEDTPAEEIEKSLYNHYESEQREKEVKAHNSAIIKKLLDKLPESERTVLTLYYLGEMTAQDVSRFLGVSVNTIKSKIHRARNRLKAEEHLLITDNLEGVQLSTDLTGSIMREIADIQPKAQITKPILPWAAAGAATMLIILLLGTINQYIAYFQKPYNVDALSDPTIEIVESPLHIDVVLKPTVRNRIGKDVTDSKTEGSSTSVSEADLAANVQENGHNSSIFQWTQANGPQESLLYNLFATSENDFYAVSSTSIYRISENETEWKNVAVSDPINTFHSPMKPITVHNGVIYSVKWNDMFTSTDGGETWNRLCSRPKGHAVELIIEGNTSDNLIMYLVLKDEGVFRSVDAGKEWTPLNNGLTGKIISTAASIGNSVFIGTNSGLYRLNKDLWEQLPVDPLSTVHSMAVSGNNLYIVTGPDYLSSEIMDSDSPDKMYRKIFHSTDFGSTWRDITPKDQSIKMRPSFMGPTKIYASDKTLLVFGVPAFRSMDGGQTWTNLGLDFDLLPLEPFPVLAVNETTFYRMYLSDILRTTDSGDTWHLFKNGMVNTRVQDVVAFNDKLYVYTGSRFFKSVDDGNLWEEVQIDYGEYLPKLTSNEDQTVKSVPGSKLIIANNELYAIVPREKDILIFCLSTKDGVFSMVQNIASPELSISSQDVKGISLSVTKRTPKFRCIGICGEVFYIEYMRRLFKWTPGSTELIDTGLTDIGNGYDRDFKLASSSEVAYIGKEDGRLFQSIDSGNSWHDITPNIPSRFSDIKDISFVRKTVYVATEMGVFTSQTGEHWYKLTDKNGTDIIIDRFATYKTALYGAGNTGVYSLDRLGRWKQILGNIPDKIISFSASHDKLYIGTEKRGIFYTSLEQDLSETTAATTRTVQ